MSLAGHAAVAGWPAASLCSCLPYQPAPALPDVLPEVLCPPHPQGMRVRPDGPQLISEMIRKELNLDCRCALGAICSGLWCMAASAMRSSKA